MFYQIIFACCIIQNLFAMHPESSYEHQGDESKSARIAGMKKWIEESKKTVEDQSAAQQVKHQWGFFRSKKEKENKDEAQLHPNSGVQDPELFAMRLIKEYTHDIVDGQIARLEGNYQQILQKLGIQHDEQIDRLTNLMGRQNTVIEKQKGMIRRLMNDMHKAGQRVKNLEEQVIELQGKSNNNEGVGYLLDAVGENTDMIMRQNAAIRVLMLAQEKMAQAATQTEQKAKQELSQMKRKLSVQKMVLLGLKKEFSSQIKEVNKKLEEFKKEIEQKLDQDQIEKVDALINELTSKWLQVDDLPIVEQEASDPEIYAEVLGTSGYKMVRQLSEVNEQEKEVITSSALHEQLVPEEDIKEGEVEEIIEETVELSESGQVIKEERVVHHRSSQNIDSRETSHGSE